MTAAKRLEPVSWQDYLDGEAVAKRKHEYREGFVYAMAGTSGLHDFILVNLHRAFLLRLVKGPCRLHTSEMKVRIRTDRGFRAYYPDCQIVCSPLKPKSPYIDDPVVVVEVLSKSTKRVDEGEKREGYLNLPSLAAYLLVDTEQSRITVWRRKGSEFEAELYEDAAAVIPLPEIGVELPLAEVYADVEWPPPKDSDDDDE